MKSIRTIIFVVGILTALALSVTFGQGATTFRKHINAPFGTTTLYAGITSGQTQFAVVSGGGNLLPTAPFSISVDNEIMLVNVKNGDLLTVSRGYDSSTASAHNVGATVDCNVIAKDFTDIETAVNGIEAGTTTLAKVETTSSIEAGSTVGAAGAINAGTTLGAVGNITSSTGNVTATVGDVTAGDDVIAGDSVLCDEVFTDQLTPVEGDDVLELGGSDDTVSMTGELNVGATGVEGQVPGQIRATSVITGALTATTINTGSVVATSTEMGEITLPLGDYILQVTAPTTYEGETPTYHESFIAADQFNGARVALTGQATIAGGIVLGDNGLSEGELAYNTIAMSTEGETIGDMEIRNPSGAVKVYADDGVTLYPITEGETTFGVLGDAIISGDTTTGTLHTGNVPDEGEPPNTTRWDANGFQVMSGDAQPWQDMLMEPVARTTGTNAPVFEKWFDDSAGTSRGVYMYSMDDVSAGSEKELFVNIQAPHSWNQSTVQMHIHWVPSVSDTAATPRWGVEYTWKNIGETYGDTVTNYYTGNTANEVDLVAGRHYVTPFSLLSPDSASNGVSSIAMIRVFRNSSDAADTYDAAGNKCGVLYLDIHYQSNTLGSSMQWAGKGEGE